MLQTAGAVRVAAGRYVSQRGIHKGAAALLWGEPAASLRASAFGWRAACSRRGGNPPAPAFPGGETGKGAFHFLAAAGYFLRFRCSISAFPWPVFQRTAFGIETAHRVWSPAH